MTELRRDNINELLDEHKSQTINPSLWLQKGLKEQQEDKNTLAKGEDTPKTKHLKDIADFKAPDLYKKAFNRWFNLTSDGNRFSQTVMTLENRLLIGLTGNGALETGCSLSRNYGMPYIPGSSLKGVVRAWAEAQLFNAEYADDLAELFGTRNSDKLDRVSGLVTFHDAWWIPQGSDKPFVLDVVTTHHQAYYNGQQDKPSDKDSPIPNHLLAVQGSFLFVLEGEAEHVAFCQTMLTHALQSQGIGAKTAAGYGYMTLNSQLLRSLQDEAEKRLTPEIREKRKLEEQQREQQAENAKTVEQVCSELKTDYENKRGNEEYIQKLEARIDYAIQNWNLEKRTLLASCLKKHGYIPTNKK
ncbi:type III-B CRISPR module RAMP protein Cmr6 [Vibrio sp. PP-XX7]